MAQRIGKDLDRFHKIIRGKIKTDLGKYISHGEMIGKKGKDLVRIPLPKIDQPSFRYGQKGNGGVGQGDGEPGQSLGPAQGEGEGGAGSGGGGEHILEVELTYEELAQILAEKLGLPALEPKQQGEIKEYKDKYTGIRRIGPESLRHNKRTFKRALKREITQGSYDPSNPKIIPIKEDKIYKAGIPVPLPQTQAAVIHMMDVSGSMSDELKDIVRTEFWWIDLWIKHHYKNIENIYIIHDDTAQEVDEHTFYHTKESGGTKISSAMDKSNELIDKKYNPDSWNLYALYRGDGDNSSDDTPKAIESIRALLPKVNMFSYGEVGAERTVFSGYMGMGISTKSKTFYDSVEGSFKEDTEKGKVRLTKTSTKEQILDSIRATFELKQQMTKV